METTTKQAAVIKKVGGLFYRVDGTWGPMNEAGIFDSAKDATQFIDEYGIEGWAQSVLIKAKSI